MPVLDKLVCFCRRGQGPAWHGAAHHRYNDCLTELCDLHLSETCVVLCMSLLNREVRVPFIIAACMVGNGKFAHPNVLFHECAPNRYAEWALEFLFGLFNRSIEYISLTLHLTFIISIYVACFEVGSGSFDAGSLHRNPCSQLRSGNLRLLSGREIFSVDFHIRSRRGACTLSYFVRVVDCALGFVQVVINSYGCGNYCSLFFSVYTSSGMVSKSLQDVAHGMPKLLSANGCSCRFTCASSHGLMPCTVL